MPAPQPGLRAISAQMSCSLEISRDRAALERQFAHPRATGRLDPELWGLCEASLRETAAVGLAEGIALPPDAVDKVIVQFRSMPPHGMTSMCNDLLRGNSNCRGLPARWSNSGAGTASRLRSVTCFTPP